MVSHASLFWIHFVGNVGGVGIYAFAVWVFYRFRLGSLHRPTCVALCWIFASLALLLGAHTVAQLIKGMEAILQFVDLGVRVLVGAAVISCARDTSRDAFAVLQREPHA